MSASSVLTRLRQAGVEIAVADGQLKLKGPKSALNEDVLNELRAIKAELLKLLSAPEPQPQSPAERVVSEWQSAVEQVTPQTPEITKLKEVSLRFLASPDALAAVENGWDAVSLFGMHEGNAPKERVGEWGLVIFLAWGVHGCTVETVDQKVCALRTRSGAVQTLRRNRANFDQSVPWWQHPGVISDASGETSEPKGANNTTSKGNDNARH
jgi:hypothetical protein